MGTTNRNEPVDVMASNAFSLSEAIASEGGHNKEHFEINEERNNLYNYQNARDLVVRFNQQPEKVFDFARHGVSPTGA